MATCDTAFHGAQCRGGWTRALGSWFRPALEWMAIRHERNRMRRELMEMPDHLLRDIGVSREDLYRELRKPFWQQ
jgi:uncharacterized protein YjiS (DUF1127 family)